MEAKNIQSIVKSFRNINGSSFVGIRGYVSSTSGEVANHVIIADFSYGNAVKHDLNALKSASNSDIINIAEKGFSTDLVRTAIHKLEVSFENNQNEETKSNQSKGQDNAYIPITNSIKLHIETGKLHIYALAHSKKVLVEGTYKTVNSRELTLCQNAVKKYFNFKTAKYRNFIIDENQMCEVNVNGETIEI